MKFHIRASFDSFTKDTFIYVGINTKIVLTGDGREFLRAPERKITILLIEGGASTSQPHISSGFGQMIIEPMKFDST